MSGRTAVLLGASGLIGGYVLDELLQRETYSSVRAIVRRPLSRSHAKLDQRIVEFANLDRDGAAFIGDDVFSCLGTTIKAAGSQQMFRAVDYEYPLAAARLARERGAQQLLLVTAIGANPGSSIFYYRVKGELERAVAALGFTTLHILRPSLLLGDRAEPRPTERLAQVLGRKLSAAMAGPLRKYRPIEAQRVAQFMVQAAESDHVGSHIWESEQMAGYSGV